MWLSTYRSFNIQLTSSDYSKLLLFVYILKLVWLLVLLIVLCYCIQTIILCIPTFFTCLHFLHNILLLSNMLYRNPIYTPSFDTYPVSHNYFEVVIV